MKYCRISARASAECPHTVPFAGSVWGYLPVSRPGDGVEGNELPSGWGFNNTNDFLARIVGFIVFLSYFVKTTGYALQIQVYSRPLFARS